MSDLTRRQLLKSGLALSATSVLPIASANALTAAPAIHCSDGVAANACAQPGTARRRLLMDSRWKFALGNACDPAGDLGYGQLALERAFAKSGHTEQAKATFDDSAWRTLDLPHDWGIELPFIGTGKLPEHGGHPLGREFPETSVGWYRKTFNLGDDERNTRIRLEFDGIFRGATVFLNGHYLADNFSGYAPFILDVTDWVNRTEPNILAIRVDATLGEGWFYEGAGIYRHVWLIKSAAVHLVEWGTWIRSDLDGASARIALGSEVENASDRSQRVYVVWQLLDSTGKNVAMARSDEISIAAWATHTFGGQASVQNPQLWSVESPTLYQAITTVYADQDAIDSIPTTFGIRSVRFDANEGFFLNGKPLKIKGTCCHQDHAGVGVALPDRIQYFRIEKLKSMGSNGLRTTHNPPTPELMEAADTLGMLVMCESRMMDSSAEGLSQLERMIRRFRNYPSIVIWSLGNEEPEQGTERGERIVSTLQRLAHQLDPTRLCTVPVNGSQGTGISRTLDVQGLNYFLDRVDGAHQSLPSKPVIGTETASTVGTRGVYETDKDAGYVAAYDIKVVEWSATAQTWWSFYDERKFLAGGFAWTGFDYRGEPTPYGWPCVSSHFGIMDSCGFPKDNYFYYKAWWGGEPVLHLFPHWNWPESKRGQSVSIWCHTNLESAELFLNGRSQGARKVARNTHAEWTVDYQPGVIEVRGSKGGKVVMTDRRETTGAPRKIVLHPDRTNIDADGEDVSMLAVEVQDAHGRTMPIADNDITFRVSRNAKLLGVGNGNPSSHESDTADHRRVFNGWAQAIVQSSRQAGPIVVQATSPGLESASVTLEARAVKLRAAVE